ncbi:phosphoenolpyruvate--protein phosphotransferase [Natronospirillum operosum]|uniref:phosphoenolpyruvate--protein phosphotransferase n=1 Tax=Natronospirillum operosum TaxID=2759953 RepID=A0A4Z0WCB2_9GAMM|nr:phosphoenolpyruvate--protein phosphotransferase [Natronospirillum operosum]TGG91305.1 phosphoenolpyruvate--protein phosphotransferase [Natronospirillum operosum]
MLHVTADAIALGREVADKDAAIAQVGDLMVQAGFMDPGYIDSMRGREQEANTLLGNGIAIPHGLQKDRELIHRTGVAVLQVPAGVDWKDGEKAHVIVGIAARSDEHIRILSNLTDVLADETLARDLAQTDDVNLLLAALNGDTAPAEPVRLSDYEYQSVVHYPAGAGLHARPATFFTELAATFEADVRVRNGDRSADGQSMSALLRLGVTGGCELVVSTQGPQAEEALAALTAAIRDGLGDSGEPEEAPVAATERAYAGVCCRGIAAAPGIAVGPLMTWHSTEVVLQEEAGEPAVEQARLRQAVAAATAEIDDLVRHAEAHQQRDEAGIFSAHRGLLADPDLLQRAEQALTAGVSAPVAWWHCIQKEVESLRALVDERLAGRASDMEDVGVRVLRHLDPSAVRTRALELGEPGILVAHDLTPTETATLDRDRVLGFVTAVGGPTSHTAILARSLGIPALVGMGPEVLNLRSEQAIVDAAAGLLVTDPTDQDLKLAEVVCAQATRDHQRAWDSRFEPALTRDAERIEVVGNIGSAAEAQAVVDHGGEGVGLLRTEFLFLGRDSAPDEDEQYAEYRAMIEALNGFPLIIRTLDIGGDKQVPYLNLQAEDNPFLGVRGIRLCLREEALFRTQLRAIYRASRHGPVKIMFPMVGLLEELRQARALAESARIEVGADPVDLGIMIEVPSAVALADAFAQEADFFSIGTNDLTQYTLAMDRMHPALAAQADALHPAVLRMIQLTCEAAARHGRWVGVCGGVAAEPLAACILAGLGVNELSMNAAAIPAVKLALRQARLSDCRTLARQALTRTTAAEVQALDLQADAGEADHD